MSAGADTTGEGDARRERRVFLLESAIAAIGEHGPGASMGQMAAAAGITKPILYRHFESKQGLVEALTRHYLAQIQEITEAVQPADLRESVATQLDAAARYFEVRPGLLEFINQERGFALAAPDEGGEYALTTLIRGLAEANGADLELVPLWTHGIGGMLNAAFLTWLEDRRVRGEGALSRRRFVAGLTAQIFDGATGTFAG